jgi:hypothetical protein
MDIIVDTSGLELLRERIAEARAALPDLLQQVVYGAGTWVAEELSAAAPVGKDGGPPPPGDAPGRLNESFYVQAEASKFADGAAISVRTRQPQKLSYVVNGRGEVLPVRKQALYWPSLAHPVRRAQPSQPNDFVTPALANAPDAQEVLTPVVDELILILGG